MLYIVLSAVYFALVFDKLNIFWFLIISSVLHEFGHIFACMIMGYKPKAEISVFGIKLSNYPEIFNEKLIVLAFGPLVNLLLFIVSWWQIHNNFSLNVYVFMCINMIILLFNMLPISFLDGGQILRLFYDDNLLNRILEFISFVAVIIFAIIMSEDVSASVIALCMFIVYYYKNK